MCTPPALCAAWLLPAQLATRSKRSANTHVHVSARSKRSANTHVHVSARSTRAQHARDARRCHSDSCVQRAAATIQRAAATSGRLREARVMLAFVETTNRAERDRRTACEGPRRNRMFQRSRRRRDDDADSPWIAATSRPRTRSATPRPRTIRGERLFPSRRDENPRSRTQPSSWERAPRSVSWRLF